MSAFCVKDSVDGGRISVKEFFLSLLHYFVDITTAILIVVAVYTTISEQPMQNMILWEILLVGLVTALPTAIFLCLEPKDLKMSMCLWTAHFLLVYFIALLSLKLFGWCSITILSALVTFLAVIFIYFFTGFVHYMVDRKHIVIMNEHLKERYHKDKIQGQK